MGVVVVLTFKPLVASTGLSRVSSISNQIKSWNQRWRRYSYLIWVVRLIFKESLWYKSKSAKAGFIFSMDTVQHKARRSVDDSTVKLVVAVI